jgi:protein phosphatase 1 regulatory subunit 14B
LLEQHIFNSYFLQKNHHNNTMEGCVTPSPAFAATSNNGTTSNSKSQTGHTNGHVSANHNSRLGNGSSGYGNTPSTPNKHVNFGGQGQTEERKREKFLTAKYGAHQMALIRKRLRVEMWMYERLQELYGADDIEIDLDEVLDMEDETDRRRYISELLRVDHGNAVSKDNVNVFVGDLLEKVKTL